MWFSYTKMYCEGWTKACYLATLICIVKVEQRHVIYVREMMETITNSKKAYLYHIFICQKFQQNNKAWPQLLLNLLKSLMK